MFIELEFDPQPQEIPGSEMPEDFPDFSEDTPWHVPTDIPTQTWP